MTLTRELRTGIAFTLAMFLVLTAFVLGNQRQAHALGLPDLPHIPQCADGVDNDNDGFIDFVPVVGADGNGPDPDCEDIFDDSEGPFTPPPAPQCSDLIDNDHDGFADEQDPNCHSDGNPSNHGSYNPSDNSETGTLPQCWDGQDNDHDGKTDWGVLGAGDPGCDTPTDNDETDTPTPPAAQCSNGSDDDGDGLIDYPADPGCTDANDTTESPNPTDTGPACSDGADNDQDGKIDMQDPGCSSPSDDDETDGGGNGSPACSDSQDNDQDGLVDYPADPGCTDASDSDETDGQGGSNDDDGDSSGGSSHRRSSGGSRTTNTQGEVLGAQTECPMYLTSYIRQGANNDMGEVARLQVFLNTYEANMLAVTGIYDAPTLAAVHAFQRKYANDVLTPWGITGATGYVYYTTQKQINTIYCKFQKEFPLSAAQLDEIAGVRTVQPAVRAQGAAGTTAGAAAAKATVPAVGSVVLPQTTADENATETPAGQSQTAAGANAPTQGWFTRFVNWLFGR